MKRVLVTGATGFIGQHALAFLLERGYEVHASARNLPASPEPRVKWHQADLLDVASRARLLEVSAPTHLLHLAWYVVPGKLITAPENFEWVTASFDLVRQFKAQGGERVTVCGSGYEYDWNYGYCSEQLTPRAPNTIYGACKLALQLMIESYAADAKLSAAWGRVFFLYGPGEHPNRLVSSVILSVLAGQPAKCSHGRQIRDYMHVQDVAEGLVALLDSDVQGAVNVSSGQATTLREIVLTAGRLMERPELIHLGALPARANDTALVVGDNTLMTAKTGWTPKLDLEAGLLQTIVWWRANSRVAV